MFFNNIKNNINVINNIIINNINYNVISNVKYS